MASPVAKVRMPISSDRRALLTSGFSLIEMLVTLAFVGVVTTIVVMFPGKLDRAILKSETAELVRFLSRARLTALESQKLVIVAYDYSCHCVLAGEDRLYLHSNIKMRNAEQTPLSIRFRPSGDSTGARLILLHGDAHADLRVDWLTGRVTVQQ